MRTAAVSRVTRSERLRKAVPARLRPSLAVCRASCGSVATCAATTTPPCCAAVEAARSRGDDAVVALFVLDRRLWDAAGDGPSRLDDPVPARARREPRRPARSSATATRSPSCPRSLPRPAPRTVHVAADFGPYGATRDAAVETALAASGRLLVRTGSPYAVAPGARREGRRHGVPRLHAVLPRLARARLALARARPGQLADVAHRRTGARSPATASPTRPRPWTSRRSARRRRSSGGTPSARDGLASYGELRDRADLAGTSSLSAHLRWGEIHPRTLLAELDDSPSHTVFRKEIAWREFYADVLHGAPQSARTWLDPRFAEMEHDAGPEADERFEAWTRGRTGFPFVDAGMRQLLAEGWMHNRVRMVTASFLVKDLHLPWQRGARWFMRQLRDGDLASNQQGWQWVAGSGTDAAPYFRDLQPGDAGPALRPRRRLRAPLRPRAARPAGQGRARAVGPPAPRGRLPAPHRRPRRGARRVPREVRRPPERERSRHPPSADHQEIALQARRRKS